MKIVVFAQEDRWVIPRNIMRLTRVPGVRLLRVVSLDVKGSLVNKKSMFIQGFGWLQSSRMAIAMAWSRMLDLADCWTWWRLLRTPRSLRAAAAKCGAEWTSAGNPNDEAFLKDLRSLQPDLVVSFSAPCVFKPALLALPRLGCINLHCSLLPRFAGLLPSFWVLYHREEESGATIHYMDDKIDNGAILGQVRVPLRRGCTMFDVIRETKMVGGELMAEVVAKLSDGTVTSVPNAPGQGSYFSWPTVQQMREFRRSGGRLI